MTRRLCDFGIDSSRKRTSELLRMPVNIRIFNTDVWHSGWMKRLFGMQIDTLRHDA